MSGIPLSRKIAATLGVTVLALSLGAVVAPQATADRVSPQEANSDMRVAQHAVDTYWRTHWSDHFTGSYSSPNVVGLYDSRQGPIPCNGDYGTSNNAWYCPATDSVGFDLVFMENVYDLGDSFLYLVVAHEWGHAIQGRLVESLQATRGELQADCLAGAALAGAGHDGTIEWEDGDAGELIDSLNAIADDYPWTSVGDHGNADQRIAAFRRGIPGPDACF